MTDEKKKMTAQGSSVGADGGQSISKNSDISTVSYTHLDVYKRQSLYLVVWLASLLESLLSIGLIATIILCVDFPYYHLHSA